MSEENVQPVQTASQQPQRIIVLPMKSGGLAVFLGVLFGPLGLLYSTTKGAIIMFFVNLVIGALTLGFGLILTWPICGVWAYRATKTYNDKLLASQ